MEKQNKIQKEAKELLEEEKKGKNKFGIRQWIGIFLGTAGGFGVIQNQGSDYIIASILLFIIGCLLLFLPSKNRIHFYDTLLWCSLISLTLLVITIFIENFILLFIFYVGIFLPFLIFIIGMFYNVYFKYRKKFSLTLRIVLFFLFVILTGLISFIFYFYYMRKIFKEENK